MEISNFQLLLDVARCGSFAAAAKERDLDPSSISRAVAEIEAHLGLRLFQRTTRRLSLTEAGDIYLSNIEPLVGEFERARELAALTSGEPQGLLRMTTSETFGHVRIVPLLKEFLSRYPKLKLECLFTDANLDLVADRIDLAIRLGPTIEGNLIASKLMDTHYRIIASKAYLDENPSIVTPQDLSRHKVLLFNIRAFRSRWIFRDASEREFEVAIDGDVTLSPAGSLRTAALHGMGCALLPNWLVDDDIARGHLVNLFPTHRVTATNFSTGAWLVYPSRAFLPNKVRVMIDFLREKFS